MFLFTGSPRHDDASRKQNSIKSLILFHIGDTTCKIMQSDLWESFFNMVVPEEHQYPIVNGYEHRGILFDYPLLNRLPMLGVFNNLPLSNRLDILAVTIIDNYLGRMYQTSMSWSSYYDKENKVWSAGSDSECIRMLFREHWFNEPYYVEPYQEEEEEEEEETVTTFSQDYRTSSDSNLSEDPWENMRESDDYTSEDDCSSEDADKLSISTIIDINIPIWRNSG